MSQDMSTSSDTTAEASSTFTLNLAIIVDSKHAAQTVVMLSSLFDCIDSRYMLELYLLESDNNFEFRCALSEWLSTFPVRLNWISPHSQVKSAHYYKHLLGSLLPMQLEKVLYLDTDILIMTDISQLWSLTVENQVIVAAQDLAIPHVSNWRGLAMYKELELKETQEYFNSGVMLINLVRWRSENIEERLANFNERYGNCVRCYDQDGLNAVLHNQWKKLDARWNIVFGAISYPKADLPYLPQTLADAPLIVHFAGRFKPANCKLNNKFWHKFDYYLKKTPWAKSNKTHGMLGLIYAVYFYCMRRWLYRLEPTIHTALQRVNNLVGVHPQ